MVHIYYNSIKMKLGHNFSMINLIAMDMYTGILLLNKKITTEFT